MNLYDYINKKEISIFHSYLFLYCEHFMLDTHMDRPLFRRTVFLTEGVLTDRHLRPQGSEKVADFKKKHYFLWNQFFFHDYKTC